MLVKSTPNLIILKNDYKMNLQLWRNCQNVSDKKKLFLYKCNQILTKTFFNDEKLYWRKYLHGATYMEHEPHFVT